MVVGFDLLSDHEKLVVWYSKDFDELRLRANYNYGVTIAKFGSTAYFATNGLS
jgi:RNA processing factor Prp31